MKKKCLLAFMAISAGAAQAQSSVTISGYMDLGFYKPTGTNHTRIDSVNANNGIKFSGVEDLGNGIKVTFALESKFSPESGGMDGSNNGRPFFQGESTVGISSGIGSVRLGRAVTPAGLYLSLADPWRNTRLGSASVSAGYAVNGGPVYIDGKYLGSLGADQRDFAGLARTDGIFYNSPNISGFSTFAAYGFKDTNSGGRSYQGLDDLFGVGVLYTGQKLGGALVLEKNREKGGVVAGFLNYDFGFMIARAGVGQYKNAQGADSFRTWVLSATFPVQEKIKLHAVYGNEKNRKTQAEVMNRFGMGANYALSRRTGLYFTVSHDQAISNGSKNAWDLGMQHRF